MASTSAAASRQSTPAFYARRAPPTRRVCCRSARAGAATKPKVRTGLCYPAGPLERPGNSDGGRPDFNSATGFSGAVANSAAGYGAREAPPRQEVLCALCTTRKAAAAHIPAAPRGPFTTDRIRTHFHRPWAGGGGAQITAEREVVGCSLCSRNIGSAPKAPPANTSCGALECQNQALGTLGQHLLTCGDRCASAPPRA